MPVTSPNVIEKQTSEILNVSMNFTGFKVLSSSESIESAEISIEPDDDTLVVSNITFSGKIVYFRIAGGTNHRKYRINVTITTNEQTVVGDGTVYVRNE